MLAGTTLWLNYDRLPWVGTHFVHNDPGRLAHWGLDLSYQEARGVGNSTATLDDIPEFSADAQLKATVRQQGRKAGGEWLQDLRIESVESVQYSWEQGNNRDLLASVWEARVGALGGLRSLRIEPESRSLWLRPELMTPWLLTLWPQFVSKGVEPKQAWTSQVDFTYSSRELNKPVPGRWQCTWSFRGAPQDTSVPLAVLDLRAQAQSDEAGMDGNLVAEMVYALAEGKLVGGRGTFSLRVAARVQATETSTVTLLNGVKGQFQIVRQNEASPTPAPRS